LLQVPKEFWENQPLSMPKPATMTPPAQTTLVPLALALALAQAQAQAQA
jgi:hypothetical protein